MMKFLACLLVGIGLAASVVAAEKPKDVISAMEDAYWNLQTYQSNGFSKIRYSGPNADYALDLNATIRFQRPKMVYLDAKSTKLEGNGQLVFDGDTYWIYRKDRASYMKTKAISSQEFGNLAPFADFFVLGMLVPRFAGTARVLEQGFDDLRMESVKSSTGVACYLLKGVYKDGNVKLWIDKKTKLIVQMSGQHRLADGASLSFYEVHKAIKVNGPMLPTAFAFETPSGALQVEAFGVRPGGLGSVDLSGTPNEGSLQNGDPCPDIKEGENGRNLFGGRKTIVSFWSLSTPGVQPQAVAGHLAMIQKIGAEMESAGVGVVSYYLGDIPDEAKAALTVEGVKIAFAQDDGTMFRAFRIGEVPTIYVIDTGGRIKGSLVGQTDKTEQMLRDIIKKTE